MVTVMVEGVAPLSSLEFEPPLNLSLPLELLEWICK